MNYTAVDVRLVDRGAPRVQRLGQGCALAEGHNEIDFLVALLDIA